MPHAIQQLPCAAACLAAHHTSLTIAVPLRVCAHRMWRP